MSHEQPGARATDVVRIMTLNLAGLEKDWFKGRAERLCAGLTPLGPDILCLQEAAIRGGPDFHHQISLIGDWLGLDIQVFVPYGNPQELHSTEQGGIAADKFDIQPGGRRAERTSHRCSTSPGAS